MDRRSLSALILILTVATASINGQECMLNGFSTYNSSRTDYGRFAVGIQALVPQYRFPCTGLVSELTARVDNNSDGTQIDLQIWRPTDINGSYTLLWALQHPTMFQTFRIGNMVIFSPSFAVPVERGDVIGFYTGSVQVLYDTSAQGITVYGTSEVGRPLCNFSVCDDSVLSHANTAPLISATYESRRDIQAELDTLDQLRIFERCSTSSFSTCTVSPTRLNLKVLQTPAPPPPPSPPPPSPSPPLRTGEYSGITSTILLPTPPPLVVTEESELSPPSGAARVNFTVETIIISVIGAVLFVVLIILVVVLAACVCHKKNSSLPLQLGRKTELGSAGNVTLSTSMSVEQTHMLMSNGIMVLEHSEASLDNSPCYSSTDGENRSPAPPFQANGMVHNRARAFSSASATVLQNGHAQNITTPARRSTSVCTTHCVSDVPRKTSLPLISTSKLSNGHPPPRYQIAHKPLPKRPESPPCNNDYSELDEPTVLKASASYDKLERYDRLRMLPDLEASCDHDEQWEEEEHEEDCTASQLYTYVPTEEQRRILQLKADGHYEMHEGGTPTVQGYDKLKFFKEADIYWTPATTTSGLYSQLFEYKYRELLRSQIRILKRIGCGHFGTVSKGVWLLPGGGSQEVAVKTVKSTSEIERIKLLQEAAIMGQFAHPNVVRLHGVVTVGDPVLIILEYMLRGDLRSFLQKIHPDNSKRELPEALPILFIKFGKDIAAGMGYLARKSFVHRDLAARNILLTHDLNCKIGDFGMARDIEGESDYYKSHGGIIPVKWTAPEALNYNKYSTASDVWSFGMVLFEIWSMGEKPFNDLSNPIVIALVSSKHCQPPPPGCPRPLYHLMVECWNPTPTQRPTFDSIHDYLDSPPDSLLQWKREDMIPGKLAHVLGAPLLEANNLYFDLQRTYQKPPLDRPS